MPHAAGDLHLVALDLHPAAATVAELAAREVAVERLAVELAGPAGRPSMMQVSPGPWDSPAVISAAPSAL